MLLHGVPGADIQLDDTLLHPRHREAGELERFDRVTLTDLRRERAEVEGRVEKFLKQLAYIHSLFSEPIKHTVEG